jgi:hypothetical protein
MTRWTKIQIIVLLGAMALVWWQRQLHARQVQQLATLAEQLRNKTEELETRKPVLAGLEQRNTALREEKNAAEKSIVAPLLKERAAVASARSAAEAAAQAEKGRAYRHAMAAAWDNPEQRELNRELLRNEIKAKLAPLVKKLGLTPEQADQCRDLLVENQLKKDSRLAALLRENVTVTDALQERDATYRESERQLRALLGDAGYALLDEGNQNNQKANVDRVLNWLRTELGSNMLNDQQSALLAGLIRAESNKIISDETDAFRSAQEWDQLLSHHQQNILRQIESSLTPEQLAALHKLAADDRTKSQENRTALRKTYGLTSD